MDKWTRFTLACRLMNIPSPERGAEEITVEADGVKLHYNPNKDEFIVGWPTPDLPMEGDFFYSNEGLALRVLSNWYISPQEATREATAAVFQLLRPLGLSDQEISALAWSGHTPFAQSWVPNEEFIPPQA